MLFASSRRGLSLVIKATFLFAEQFNDIAFNPSKSRIVRLGTSKKNPVSVCDIPTASTYEYLGVEVGPAANLEAAAISKLYRNTNLLLKQNRELKKCGIPVKNICIYSYGNV